MPREEFKPEEVETLLVACHRRCCVCHKFCGVKIEMDHIIAAITPQSGNIDNAIPVCFDCHAEIHHYNPSHPKGRKFQPSELRRHKEQWLAICQNQPEIFVHSQPPPEAGSLERLLNELEFNRAVANAGTAVSGRFEMIQFRRAIADGTFTWISEELKKAIMNAYVAMQKANFGLDGMQGSDIRYWRGSAVDAVNNAKVPIQAAIDVLLARAEA